MACPELLAPVGGFFVRGHGDRCPSVLNAACGVRCRPGRQLRGSGIRICLPNGQWSGEESR